MRKKNLLYTLILLLAQAGFTSVFAVRAIPSPVKVTQPDGSQLTIRVHGDEHSHYQTTDDGFLIKQNVKGVYVYGTVAANGSIIEDSVIAKNLSKRSVSEMQHLQTLKAKSANFQVIINQQSKSKFRIPGTARRKAYPLIGAPKALVILANFKDKAFAVTSAQASFQNLVTQPGYSANGGTGSAKDYFMASTYGKFAPDFVVVGPVTLPQTLDYYGKNDASDNDTNPAQMIVDACAAANNTAGVDFTQYDTDGDGFVDNVFVYYAGYNEAEGGAANTIWPHRWSISSAGITTGITFDGKKIEDYSCTSELKSTSGTNMCGVGTFCHEFGHVLGLPDYYNTSGGSTYIPTLETWDIMDYGPYLNDGCTPPTYSAWDRFYLGYLTPQQLSASANVTLQPLYLGTTQPANTDGQAYLIAASAHNMNATSPNPSEFFLVEYRKHTGWDTYLGQNTDANGNFTTVPADGVCIWHIDYLQSDWDNNGPNNANSATQTSSSHMRVYLQPLSGQTVTPGSIFTSGSFNPTKWSGTSLNMPITNIAVSPSNATFKFMGGVSVFGAFSATAATNITNNSFTANWGAAIGATKYLLNVYKKTITTGGNPTTETEGFSNVTPDGTGKLISSATYLTGWTASSQSTTRQIYTTATNFGASSPSFAFTTTGDYIKTKQYTSSITTLSFWAKQQSGATSSTLIEGYNGTSWVTIANLSNADVATAGTKTYDLGSLSLTNIVQVRFTFTKVAGNLSIDDISITSGQGSTTTQTDILKDFEILSGTSYPVTALATGTYYYTVKAANATQTSAESNEIEVSLVTGINSSLANRFAVRADKGSVNVTSTTNEVVRIFDSLGRTVKSQAIQAGVTSISLPSNQMYIVRVGGYTTKVVVR
ncbi:MAG: M6 family metalloprotease domain-containing protein [Bacteroidales bacterium]